MLNIPILVTVDDGVRSAKKEIHPGWWKDEEEDSLIRFVRNWDFISHRGLRPEKASDEYESWRWRVGRSTLGIEKSSVVGWPGKRPQHVCDSERLVSSGGQPAHGVLVCAQGIAIQQVPAIDITGISEIGAAELSVSRAALTSDPEEGDDEPVSGRFARRFRSDIRPAIVKELDGLTAHGMLPGRIGFIRGLSLAFGTELLDQTQLNWIPVTAPPGDLIHYSKQGFQELLHEHVGVVLGIGATAATMYGLAGPHVAASDLSRMLVIAVGTNEVKVEYDVERRFEFEGHGESIQGTLDYLLSLKEVRWHPIVLEFLVGCIARGWDVPIDTLRAQRWHLRYKEDIVWAELRRRMATQEK